MKDLLLYMANAIVEKPNQVKVEETSDETGLITYTISVDSEDMGRIIGKEGKTIGAIRSLARVAGRKQGKRIRVDLKEPAGVVEKKERPENEELATSLEELENPQKLKNPTKSDVEPETAPEIEPVSVKKKD